jgi:hypothetical protein
MKGDFFEQLDTPQVEPDPDRPQKVYVEETEIRSHGIAFLALIALALAVAVLSLLAIDLPAQLDCAEAAGAAAGGGAPAGASGAPTRSCASGGVALAIFAISSGAVGGLIHSATSFAEFTGNRQLLRSWLWWFYLRAPIGALLAFVVYLGHLAGTLGSTTLEDREDVYLIGFLGALAGLFSKQVAQKLSDVVDALFAPTKPGRLQDPLGPAAHAGSARAAEAADETVRRVQDRLVALGYLPTTRNGGRTSADGVLDQLTRDAIARFLDEKLGTDQGAIVGEETDPDYWPRLEGLLEEATTARQSGS